MHKLQHEKLQSKENQQLLDIKLKLKVAVVAALQVVVAAAVVAAFL